SCPAFLWTPTISLGFAGLTYFIFSLVFTNSPPMIRSYSRPSSAWTLANAARIARALSGWVKSTNGSLTNFVVGSFGVMREVVSSAVAISPLASATERRQERGLTDYFTPSGMRLYPMKGRLFGGRRRNSKGSNALVQVVANNEFHGLGRIWELQHIAIRQARCPHPFEIRRREMQV